MKSPTLSFSAPSRLFVLVCLGTIGLSAAPGFAQGLTDSVTDLQMPSQQTAASDDAWAMYSNPAGLAYVDTLQLVAGYSGRITNAPVPTLHLGQTILALQPIDGLTFAAAAGGFQPIDFSGGGIAPTGLLRGSFASAARLGRTLAVGIAVHGIRNDIVNAPVRWRGSFGFQLRPAPFVAVGAAFENIGAGDTLGAEQTTMRTGVSVRPLGEILTVGLDARMTGGSRDPLSDTFFALTKIEPALTARAQFGGIAVVAGVRAKNLRPLNFTPNNFPLQQDVSLEASLLLEVNTAHFGAALLGGASFGANDPFVETVEMGAYARFSAEAFRGVVPDSGRWLAFSLSGRAVPNEAPGNIVEELFSSPTPPEAFLAELARAAHDPSVEGIVLRLRSLSIGWGRATEFRTLIKHLRESGKFVAVHLDGGSDVHMYIASAANRIFVSPAAQLDLNGVHANLTFIADALSRVGIKAEAIAAGAYKSAPRTFTHDEPSKEQLEVEGAILDEVFGILVQGIASGRDLSEEEVRDILNFGGVSADEAKEKRLVDGISYWANITDVLEEEEEINRKPRLDFGYLDRNERVSRWDTLPTIAIVPVVGTIQQGRAGGGLFNLFGDGGVGADDVIDALEAAMEDDDVRAVVVRIDSPGGDALASDLIWNAVMRVREKKHVVVSMGDLAASGGYYIAAAGEHIYAQPDTLTGSIGVFSLFFQGEQLANDLGVRTFEISRGGASSPTLLTSPSAQSRAVMERQVAQIYDRFLDAIIQGRDIDRDKLKAVAGGRVWTGRQALERNLVDELGGLDDALNKARSLAGLDEGEDSEIAIFVGDNEALPRLSTAVSALLQGDADVVRARRAVRAVLGSHAATLELAAEGRPLLMDPVLLEIR